MGRICMLNFLHEVYDLIQAGAQLRFPRVCACAHAVHLVDSCSTDLPAAVSGQERVAISTLLACGRVHHHLVAEKKRMLAGLLLETGEARDVHHMCTLLGYGADAICPYLAMEAIVALQEDGKVDGRASRLDLIDNFIKVCAPPVHTMCRLMK